MSRRKLTSATTVQWLSGGEGGGPVAWEAAPSSGEARGPTHEDGKRVRRLDTDGVAETEARRGGGGLPEEDKRRWRGHNARVRVSSYRRGHWE
jgi:hypothetical protein